VRKYKKEDIIPVVCDHNSLEGSNSVNNLIKKISNDIPNILAEEIMTSEGELIGIFLSDEILPFKSARETIQEIHDQGGLVLLPHPFDQFRKMRLADAPREALVNQIDIIEGYNSRNLSKRSDEMAVAYAQQCNKPVSAGSDAHSPFEIGNAWTEMEVFSDSKEFLRNLKKATYFHKPSGFGVHAITKIVKLVRS
jgi:predicted metal-dependent phosphoesterase TrpH